MHVELAQQHHALLSQAAHAGGILRRNVVRQDLRSGGGANALGLVQVLDREGDAVQRTPPLALPEAPLGLCGLGHRLLREQGDESVQLRIQRFDALQAGAGELRGRQFARLEAAGGLGDGELHELVSLHAALALLPLNCCLGGISIYPCPCQLVNRAELTALVPQMLSQ